MLISWPGHGAHRREAGVSDQLSSAARTCSSTAARAVPESCERTRRWGGNPQLDVVATTIWPSLKKHLALGWMSGGHAVGVAGG
jgi:hypothetical protein